MQAIKKKIKFLSCVNHKRTGPRYSMYDLTGRAAVQKHDFLEIKESGQYDITFEKQDKMDQKEFARCLSNLVIYLTREEIAREKPDLNKFINHGGFTGYIKHLTKERE